MQDQKNIIACYDKTAVKYAEHFYDELAGKHFDSLLLHAFASSNKKTGKCIDLGCGPGQTTKFMANEGLTDIIGIDLSPAMIAVAKKLNPALHFEIADMLQLPYADKNFSCAIAFYSFVHFNEQQLQTAFKEIKRVLAQDAQFLFSFHIGDNTLHMDHFLDHTVDIDFHFFETKKIMDLLHKAGFVIMDEIEREPYKNIEYQSRRAYIWVRVL